MSGNLIPIKLNGKTFVQQMPQQVKLPPLKLPDISLQNQLPLIPIDLNISPQFEQNTNIQPSVPVFTPDTFLTKPNENNSFEKSGMEILGSEFKRILQDDSGSLNITRVLEIYDKIKKWVKDYISQLPPLITLHITENDIITNKFAQTDTKAARKQRVENLINNNYQVLRNMLGFYTLEETAIEPLKSVMDELLSDKMISSFLFEGNPDDKKLCQRIMVYSRFVYEIEHKSKDGRKTFLSNINKALSDEILEKYSDFTLKAQNITILYDFIDNVDILTRNPEFLEANREISHLYPSIYASLARYTEEHPEYRDLIVSDINGILAFKNNYGVNVLEAYLPIFGNLFSTQKFDFKQIVKIFEDKKMQLGQIQEVAEIFKNHKNVSGRIIINQSNNYNEETIEKYRQIAQNDKEKIYDIESIRYFDTQTVEKFKTEHPDLIKFISSGFVSLHTLLSLSEEIDLNKVKEFLEKLSKADSKNTLTYKSVNKFLGQMCKNAKGDFEWNDEKADKILQNLTKLLKADKFKRLEQLVLNQADVFFINKNCEKLAEILNSEKLKNLSDESLLQTYSCLNKNMSEKICDTMSVKYADYVISNLWRNTNIRGEIKTKERFVDLLVKIYKTDTDKRLSYPKFINSSYDIDTLELVIGNLNIDKSNTRCIMPILMALETNPEFGKKIISDEKYKLFREAENVQHIEEIIDATDKNTEELTELLCCDEKYAFWRTPENIQYFSDIIKNVTNKEKEDFAKILITDEKYRDFREKNSEYIANIIRVINKGNKDFAKKVILNKSILGYYMADLIKNADLFRDSNLDDVLREVEIYKNKMLQNPELYINGESLDAKEEIKEFFNVYYVILVKAFHIFDKEAIDNLMRRRLEDAGKYLCTLKQFNTETLELLQKIVCCNNISDKPLMPSQKVECIDLIKAFEDNNISLSIIENAIVDNKVDLGSLKTILFKEILKNCGMKEEQIDNIPKEKLMSWNLEYIHLLPKSIKKDSETFTDLLNASNSDDFMKYIHDENNDYGKANKNTKVEFEKIGMNYNNWEKPDKALETTFISKDKNTELILQLSNLLLEDINELRNTPVKGFFDKQFSKFIQNGKFALPNEVMTSKANLTELIKNIIEQLKPVWERAEKNKDNPQKQEAAQKTLTILSHLKTKLESLENMNDIQKEKSYDLTIKMWDRNPQKDLFQGNFSTCCIGMGEANGEAMPHYLMNTTFNMIEMLDNATGKTIGNALCYFAQDKKGTPIFVIDNIEINNSQKPSAKTGIELRKKIFEYAANVAKSVTGKETDVIMSGSYNDVELDGLKQHNIKLKFIGDIDCEKIYMDLFDGWTEGWNDYDETKYYKK